MKPVFNSLAADDKRIIPSDDFRLLPNCFQNSKFRGLIYIFYIFEDDTSINKIIKHYTTTYK